MINDFQNESFKDGFLARQDMEPVYKSESINDNIIDGKLIGRKVYAFSAQFFAKYSKDGYPSVRNRTRKVDLFSFELILVPIHWKFNEKIGH